MFWCALFLGFCNAASAHDSGLSIATATHTGSSLVIMLAMARSDVERLVPLDSNHDGKVSESEFQTALPNLQTMARQAFRVTAAEKVLAPASAFAKMDRNEGVQFQICFKGVIPGPLIVEAKLLDDLPRGHRQFFSLQDRSQSSLGEQMLSASGEKFVAELTQQAVPPGQLHSAGEFVRLGVEHIATGYDHLLFLLGLLLVGGSLRVALKIITSFTLAHSITLALATLNIINIAPKVIEPLIAASIVFVGIQNLLGRGIDKRWLLTFGFGLIHGCGFASALRDLGIGADGGSFAVPLISFNLGVEFGQMAIAAVVLPCIWKYRSSPVFVQRFVPVASGMIVIAGGYWFLARMMWAT